MRELKFHEKKLLKKVDFYDWKNENNLHELKVVRRYHLQDREDYTKYNKICGIITKITSKLKQLKQDDPFRVKITEQMLDKLYQLGIITSKKSLELCEKISVSALCRRRIGIVLQRLKFCETVKEAVGFVEQGHIRIGTEVVTDPSMLVTRTMEDYLTWTDTSSIRKKVLKYNDKLDDFDLME